MIRTSSTHTKTWYLFSEGLKYLFKRRNAISKQKLTDFQIASINSSILLHLAATVEGAVNSLLYTKLANSSTFRNAKLNHDLEIVRVYQSQIDSLQKATWKTLSEEIAQTVVGFSLQSIYKDDWNAIKYLFEFRNILAHGGIIVNTIDKISADTVFRSDTQEITKENLTKKAMFKYLQGNKLIESIEDYKILNWKFINNNVTDFFHSHAKTFLLNLYAKYERENQVHIFLEDDKIAIGRL